MIKKILIISFSEIHRDPRVMRQIDLLSSEYDLTVLGFGRKPNSNIKFIEAEVNTKNKVFYRIAKTLKLLFFQYERYYWSLPHVKDALFKLESASYDLILANDINALPLANKLNINNRLLFDAHEYSPKELDNNLVWKLLFKNYNKYICRKYLQKADEMITVCEGIAREYKINYKVNPCVVFNAPYYQNLSPSNVDKENIRIIHHGSSIKERHLEDMILMMDYLDSRFSLDFMLLETDKKYLLKLKKLAKKNPKINFIEPVNMKNISRKLNDYDIGVYLLKPDNFNHKHALPNKFFEFIQANLCVLIGPSEEMVGLVNKYSCGIVADSFQPIDLAKKLMQLSHNDIIKMKMRSYTASKQLCFESTSNVIKDKISYLLSLKTT